MNPKTKYVKGITSTGVGYCRNDINWNHPYVIVQTPTHLESVPMESIRECTEDEIKMLDERWER